MKTTPGAPRIAIVIPYFQKESGLLKQCVSSIIAQKDYDDYQIIIVDDGSPAPAELELESFSTDDKKIRLVKQENAGPGAARNAGLDHVIPGTRYVAFLDSDDQWENSFLSDAVFALDLGHELFFGNSSRAGFRQSRFEWGRSPELNITAQDHKLLDTDRELYQFHGDFFDLLVHRSSIIGTTTMAYCFEKFSTTRFNEKLYNGQDRVFKLTLGRASDNVAFSPKVYAFEGEGVNIFDRSQWGTERSLGFLSSYINLPKVILEDLDLNPAQRKYVCSQLDTSRYSFAASLMHLIKARKSVDWKIVRRTFREDPMTAILLPQNLITIVFRKLVAKK